MPFTLRQLEIFVEAAKDENFRKTADRLNIAQPSISKHVKALERAAGGVLFTRDRGSAARLSPLGREMVARAHSMLKMAGKMRDGSQVLPPLRLAAGAYLLDRLLRPIIRDLLSHHELPEIRFASADDGDAVRALLRAGAADCGFYHGDAVQLKEFSTRELRRTTVGLYAAPELAAKVRDLPGDLHECPFILSLDGSDAELYQRRQLEAAGVRPKAIVARSQYSDYQLELVLAGRGVGLLFDDDTGDYVAAGELVRFPISFVGGMRCMATSLSTPPDPRHNRAIDLICQCLSAASPQYTSPL